MAQLAQGEAWLSQLEEGLGRADLKESLFHPRCGWRDLLGLTWNIRTFIGPENVCSALNSASNQRGADSFSQFQIVSFLGDTPMDTLVPGEEGNFSLYIFSFRTSVGVGEGVLRLLIRESGTLCVSLFTALQSLHSAVPLSGAHRHLGFEPSPSSINTCEVLVIGAGQAGLALAARLSSLSIRTILIDENIRVGDNWRKRYDSLHLHDPVWYDHFPFLPFPSTWPVFPTKDKFGDWLECYSRIMSLDVRMGYKVASANRINGQWTLECVSHEGGAGVTFTGKHVVLATGFVASFT
jgi:putative flavoprotein involved in K+ transport